MIFPKLFGAGLAATDHSFMTFGEMIYEKPDYNLF